MIEIQPIPTLELYHFTTINRRHEFEPRDLLQFVEDMDKEHAYSFMARCVACPISQPLFSNELMEPRSVFEVHISLDAHIIIFSRAVG